MGPDINFKLKENNHFVLMKLKANYGKSSLPNFLQTSWNILLSSLRKFDLNGLDKTLLVVWDNQERIEAKVDHNSNCVTYLEQQIPK